MDSFTAEERTMTIHEFREADAYKKRKLGEILVGLAPLIAIVMILTIFMLFFGQTVAPTIELANSNVAASKELTIAVNGMQAVCLNRPMLDGQAVGGGNFSSKVPN
jgi:hypothetical protein